MPHGPPPTTSVTADKGNKKLFVWLILTFVGMLAVAALVFVLMLENKTDKAERSVREAKIYMQEDNLLAAKVLLEEAVELYSKDAESLLENVTAKLQANQLAEQQQREKEKQRRIAAKQLEEERRRKQLEKQEAERLAAKQLDEERRKKQLEKQEAERLAAEQELKRLKESEEARLREAIRKELELARKAEEERAPKKVKPKSLPDLLQQVLPSVVSIKVDNGHGCGFVIGPNMVCTNHHVIDGTTTAKVRFNNAVTHNAEGSLYESELMDIAILKVNTPPGIRPLELHPRDPRQGVKVYAIGNPQGSINSVTDGIVSKVHTTDSFRKMTKLGNSGTWVQTNTEINAGNSGGPLINASGVVVGMSTLGSNSQLGLVNINFATSSQNISEAIRLAGSREVSRFDGKQDGLIIRRRKNGTKKDERHYKNGRLDGPSIMYHSDGYKMIEHHYKDGKRDGIVTSWYKNGQKRWEGYYKNGKMNGLRTWWNENGKKTKEEHYKDDTQDGLWTEWYIYKLSQKRVEGHYRNATQEGLWTEWHPNGQKKSEEHYKNGKKEGLWTEWHANGQKKSEAHYKNGRILSRKEF